MRIPSLLFPPNPMSFRLPHEDSPLDAPPLADMSAILVVDEDPAFQLGLKTFLREYVGFEKVFTARSGQEAIDFIRAEPSIEVITLDYRMPGMNGIEVMAALAAQVTRPLAVLMITGYASEELEAEFRAHATETLLATHFLTKPVQFEKLEPVVLAAHEEVIATKRRLRERELAAAAEAAAALALPDDARETESSAPSDLGSRLDAQGERLAAVEQELRAQRGKWRADFWRVAFVLLLFWLAGQFGLFQSIAPRWTAFKAAAIERVGEWKRALESPAAKDASEAPAAPEAAPTAPEASPAPVAPAAPATGDSRGEPL